jgi:hypothetical protein
MMKPATIHTLKLMGLILTAQLAFGQLDAPNVEAVYGGRNNDITGIALTADTTRLFIATESANSLFYADIYSNSTSQTYGAFQVMPGADANAGFGSGIQKIAAHGSSGMLYFIQTPNSIIKTDPASTITSSIYSGLSVNALEIYGDRILLVDGNELHFGDLDASGNVTWDADSPLTFSSPGGFMTIDVNPIDSLVYIFTDGSSPTIVKTSDGISSLNASTTFSTLPTTGLGSSLGWVAFGISPSGRLFVAASDMTDKYIGQTDDEITWTTAASGTGGVAGRDFAFAGDSADYVVYHAKMFNHEKGDPAFWHTFGAFGGAETHPNDGSVFADPINPLMAYMTTDQGIGVTEDEGNSIFEIDEGLEAVQVNDFDQTLSKMTGWVASKSGIRRVDDYLTGALWTNAIFPNGDGSPYYSVGLDHTDSNKVFVGNVRVYYSHDEGSNWSQVFTPENAPYHFSNVGTKCLALEVFDEDPNVVFAGYEIQGSDKGGVFYSHDGGSTWDQLLLHASSNGQDVDISDIVFNIEGSDTVAYMSAIYDLSAPQGYSVYRAVKSGSTWTVSQDMSAANTSTGSVIVVTLWDLELSPTTDTLYAVGTDAGVNHPTAYYKPINGTNLWTVMPITGFPVVSGAEATAVTIGLDTVYVAVANEIYSFDLSGTSWGLGYAYPVGTRINMLFYDELLAGTDLGLFGHNSLPTVGIDPQTNLKPLDFSLEQNYPNPFNPSTSISFGLEQPGYGSLTVHNVRGQEIARLVSGSFAAGRYSYQWNGRDHAGQQVASGIYFYRLNVNDQSATRKMMLLK